MSWAEPCQVEGAYQEGVGQAVAYQEVVDLHTQTNKQKLNSDQCLTQRDKPISRDIMLQHTASQINIIVWPIQCTRKCQRTHIPHSDIPRGGINGINGGMPIGGTPVGGATRGGGWPGIGSVGGAVVSFPFTGIVGGASANIWWGRSPSDNGFWAARRRSTKKKKKKKEQNVIYKKERKRERERERENKKWRSRVRNLGR